MKRFEVDDLAKAEWCMKKIRAYQTEIEEKEKQAEDMKAAYAEEVDGWLDGERERAQSQIAYLSGLLRPFVDGELAKSDGKKKSVSLPSGRCGYRAGRVKFYFGGEEASGKNKGLCDWAKDNAADCIVTEERVDWQALKKRFVPTEDGRVMTADGEVYEGFSSQVGEAEFYVKGVE